VTLALFINVLIIIIIIIITGKSTTCTLQYNALGNPPPAHYSTMHWEIHHLHMIVQCTGKSTTCTLQYNALGNPPPAHYTYNALENPPPAHHSTMHWEIHHLHAKI